MIEAVFVVLYGLAFIGGLFMAWVWGKVAYRARCLLSAGTPDQFCLIAVGLCVGSLSNIIIFGARVGASFRDGVDASVTDPFWAPFALAGLLVLGASKWILMWAHDPRGESRAWRWFVGVSLIWTLTAPFFSLGRVP